MPRLLRLLLVLVGIASACPARAATSELARFADDVVAPITAKCRVPGLALSVVKDGEVVLARGWGLADVERGVPVDPERTAFPIASVTKAVTATAVTRLVAEGRIALDADLRPVLRDVPALARLDAPITLEQVLTHTSGLDESLIGCGAPSEEALVPLAEHLAAHPRSRVFAPGTVFHYTNHNATIAGLAIEAASGKPYATYVHDAVLAPLGMNDSGFDVGSRRERLAIAYEVDGERPRAVPYPFMHDVPAGGMIATAADMARFVRAHLQDPTLASMHDARFRFHPALPGIALGFMEERHDGRRFVVHEGSMAGYQSKLSLVPDAGIGVFVALDGASPECDVPGDVTRALVARLAPPVPTAAVVGSASSSPPAGRYRSVSHPWSTYEKASVLLAGRDIVVSPLADGAIVVAGRVHRPIGEGAFERDDQEGRLAFRGGLASSGLRTYRRVAWHESLALHRGVLLLCIVAFLGCLVAVAIAAVRRRARASTWLAGTVAALDLAFLVGVVAPFVRGGLRFVTTEPPLAYRMVFWIPAVAGAAALVLLAVVVRRRRGALAASIAFVHLAFVVTLAEWNLLGFHG